MRLLALIALSSLAAGAAGEPQTASEQLMLDAARAGFSAPPPPAPPSQEGAGTASVEDEVAAQLAGTAVPRDFVRASFADPRRKLLPEVPPQAGKPAESLPYEKYRLLFLSQGRISAGARFAKDRGAVLDEVAAKYDVDKYLLLALVGVETYYGTEEGRHLVFNALDTQAEEIPAHHAFGVRELAAWLELCWENKLDPFSVKGSYAGAFGYGQFIPSTFNHYAVDFDGDGKRSFDQWPDALASIANYLLKMGYPAGTADYSEGSKAWKSVYAYNHSANYVNVVLELRSLVKARAERS